MNRNLGVQFHSLREVGSWRSQEYGVPMDSVPARMVHEDEQGGSVFDDRPHQPYVEHLAASMRVGGYDDSNPITAEHEGPHGPHVADGHHRFAAAREAGLTHIAVHHRRR